MRSIFFEDKVVNFTAPQSVLGEDFAQLEERDFDIAKVLQKLENSKTLWVVSPDYLALFDRFCSLFIHAEAAGGVVRNLAGEVLMIRRQGRWDLPKGHREAGEDWAACAVREVEEECGISSPVCGRLLTTTWHTYLLDGRWMLKECRWYEMNYGGDQALVPQIEEGIEEVRWFASREIAAALEGSYETIKNVINSIK